MNRALELATDIDESVRSIDHHGIATDDDVAHVRRGSREQDGGERIAGAVCAGQSGTVEGHRHEVRERADGQPAPIGPPEAAVAGGRR